MILSAPRPSESTHWYALDGTPAYEVRGANGAMRSTTLRDARKLNLVPSVTTIIKCAAAPGLEAWKQQQVLLSALTLPRTENEPESAWLDRVMQDSKEQGRKAADRGTAIHAAVQGHYEGEPPKEEYWPYVKATARKIEDYFGKQEWIAEKPFAHALGFGGKVDLHCRVAAIDVKSKEFYEDAKKLAWDEHCMQLAAYRVGLGTPLARCANIFVSTAITGLVIPHEWDEECLMNGWKMFQGLLFYWQAKNRYVPNFAREAA
jgi:hypothetical protein